MSPPSILRLLRLAGNLWDIHYRAARDESRMTGHDHCLSRAPSSCRGSGSMGHSYLTAWSFPAHHRRLSSAPLSHLHTLIGELLFAAGEQANSSRLTNDVTVIQSVVTETPIDSAKQLCQPSSGGIAFLC